MFFCLFFFSLSFVCDASPFTENEHGENVNVWSNYLLYWAYNSLRLELDLSLDTLTKLKLSVKRVIHPRYPFQTFKGCTLIALLSPLPSARQPHALTQ